jgi:hypothetical protein
MQARTRHMSLSGVVAVALVFVLGGSLQAADPFVGTWKLNVAKSKPAPAQPGMAVKEETFAFQVTSDQFEVIAKGTRENGSAISAHAVFPPKGGPIAYSDGAPPAGTSLVMKRISDSAFDLITTRDGKVVSTNHVTLSADGKTMRGDIKGIDAQGKPVQGLELWDKQ